MEMRVRSLQKGFLWGCNPKDTCLRFNSISFYQQKTPRRMCRGGVRMFCEVWRINSAATLCAEGFFAFLGLGDHLFGDIFRASGVVAELHGELATSGSHGA